ncbi:MAG: GrpB family protein [Nanoarchaeota archaeon]|nr:GrpB family protein [Nanoarchaeota archaeon]
MPAPKGWFDKFSATEKVKILPHNPKIHEIAEEFIKSLHKLIGKKIEIERRGASTLGISGKGEIDLYVRVFPEQFSRCLRLLKERFGEPQGVESGRRARFNYFERGIEIEIILIHKDHPDEIEGRKFFNYLKMHPKALKEYERVKKKYAQISEREYYLQKAKFIAEIIKLADKN